MMRSMLLFGTVGSLLLAAGGRLAFIEQSQGATLRAQAVRQQTSERIIPALRGAILDSSGRTLAQSIRHESVFVDPALVLDVDADAELVAPILGMKPTEVREIIESRRERRFAWIKRAVGDAEADGLRELIRERGLDAFGLLRESRREYPFGRTGSHLLGFVGAEHRGLAGVEQAFDATLAGRDGRRVATVDVRRRTLSTPPDTYEPPVDGDSVVLTIDSYLQQRTEHHLRQAVERPEVRAQWGCAVLLDPRTGEVLALATYPDFDPADAIPYGLRGAALLQAQERLRNRAISDSFEPGSIFKPFIAGPAFDAKLVGLDDVFQIDGPARNFGRRTLHDTHAYGALPLYEVISKSSNIGMALLGNRLGNQRLYEFVRGFGFGDPTGLPLPGEHDGIVHELEHWTSYSTNSIPMGQELSVTPIQVAAAFAVFANDGVLYRPRVVRGVMSSAGEIVEDLSRPIPIRRVMDPAAARTFRLRALAEVVASGTGRQAALPGYQVFGKTGTAQVARADGRGYIPNTYTGSFVGGAPAADPAVVALVSIRTAHSRMYYGGSVAAPAVGAILADALAYMQIPPDDSLLSQPARGEPREVQYD